MKGAEVVPGTVLAFFPGAVHLNEFARKEEYVNRLLPDDHFNLISRYKTYLTFLQFILMLIIIFLVIRYTHINNLIHSH